MEIVEIKENLQKIRKSNPHLSDECNRSLQCDVK